MSSAQASGSPSEQHPLLQGASPSTVRTWLLVELRRRFDQEYREAIDEARATYELEGLHALTERWRQLAVLQTDPQRFHATMRAAAELATGQPSPEDESLETTLTKAGL